MVLVRPMIGMKLESPDPARHDVLVEVGADAGAAGRALVHAEVEALALRDTDRSTVIARLVSAAISATSSTVVSV